MANAWNHEGYVNQSVMVTTYHEYIIRNQTNVIQRYHVKTQENSGNLNGSYEFDLDIPSGGYYQEIIQDRRV